MCPCDYSNSACSEGKSPINTRDMLLAFLLLQCFLCGSFAAQHEVCYGGTFRFPYGYSGFSGKLYFSPKNGEGRRLVFENGKAMDPRFKVTFGSLSLQHVTEKDNGYFSVSSSSFFLDRITLKVLECADAVQRYYHSRYRVNIPSNAEILEFSTFDNSDLVILWNRTQSSGASRGQVKQNSWEMSDITQADNGYYNFRKKDYTLLTRKKLTVTEYTSNYQPKEGTHFTMRFPVTFKPWDITFKPRMGESDPIRVMRSGRLTNDDYFEDSHFEDRLVLESRNLEILSVKVEDSGIYELRDNNGFLVFVANVAVEEVHTPAYVYVILFAAIVAAFAICCCCIKRCCCKKSASKTNAPQTSQAAAPAPAVYYHGTNQPTGQSYSAAPPPGTYSYQPGNPVVPRGPSSAPAPTSVGPPAYNSVDIHPDPNPTQREAVVSTGHNVAPAPSLAFDCSSSDSDPKFELKGLRFSSDLPLTSDSTFSSVYTSDKLNF